MKITPSCVPGKSSELTDVTALSGGEMWAGPSQPGEMLRVTGVFTRRNSTALMKTDALIQGAPEARTHPGFPL